LVPIYCVEQTCPLSTGDQALTTILTRGIISKFIQGITPVLLKGSRPQMLIRILGLIAEKEFRRLIVSRSLGGYGIEKDVVIDHELVVKINHRGLRRTPYQRSIILGSKLPLSNGF